MFRWPKFPSLIKHSFCPRVLFCAFMILCFFFVITTLKCHQICLLFLTSQYRPLLSATTAHGAVSLQRQNHAALNWSVSCLFDFFLEDECWGKLTSSASSSIDMDLIWPWVFEVPGLIHLPSCAIISSNHINTGFKGSGQMLITYTGPHSACICVEGENALFFPLAEGEAPVKKKTLNLSDWSFHFPF